MEDDRLIEGILRLKEERNAVILGHNYQIGPIQDISDFVGDSFQLAKAAEGTDAEVIVFCGVDFMAETAAIVNPEKTVLLPEIDAQCPMAAMLPPDVIEDAKRAHPDAEVVMYINTHAEAKVHADIICTSGNSVKVVQSMDADEILFAPDKNLAHFVSRRTGKKIIPVPEYGMCVVHDRISLADIQAAKASHPDAKVAVHAEICPEVQEIADHVGSTKTMVDYVKTDPAMEFIIGTESGIIHRMEKEAPNKSFYPSTDHDICKNMKKINLTNLYEALDQMKYVIEVPKDIAEKALIPIQRMLDLR